MPKVFVYFTLLSLFWLLCKSSLRRWRYKAQVWREKIEEVYGGKMENEMMMKRIMMKMWWRKNWGEKSLYNTKSYISFIFSIFSFVVWKNANVICWKMGHFVFLVFYCSASQSAYNCILWATHRNSFYSFSMSLTLSRRRKATVSNMGKGFSSSYTFHTKSCSDLLFLTSNQLLLTSLAEFSANGKKKEEKV